MGASLLLDAAHWATDIVGGGLLATAVLAIASANGASRWIHDQVKDIRESPRAELEDRPALLTPASEADIDSRPI
jgi:membrane-associated phospholipid phosphatase